MNSSAAASLKGKLGHLLKDRSISGFAEIDVL